jgi:hypothetical protein
LSRNRLNRFADGGLDLIDARSGIDHPDTIRPPVGLGQEPLSDALQVVVAPLFDPVGRAAAAGQCQFNREVEHEGQVRL